MKKYAFGVDIGGTTCKIGFFDTRGELIDKWEIRTNTENKGRAFFPMSPLRWITSWRRRGSARTR